MPCEPTQLLCCLRTDLEGAINGAVTCQGLEDMEERLGQITIAALTTRQCLLTTLRYRETETGARRLVNSLQQTLLLSGLSSESKRTMITALLSLCKSHRIIPSQLKINAAAAASMTLSSRDVTQLPNRDVFHRLPFRGRLVQVDFYRAKSDAREATIKAIIHDAILRFNHPHHGLVPLVGVHQFNQQFERTSLISPHFEHGTILRYIAYTENVNRCSLLKDVAQTLFFLHTNGIAHGNLKPSAIIVDDEGRARLAGTGIGVLTHSDGVICPTTAPTLGDFFWMAPELMQAHAAGELATPTYASDIWSFGLLACEIFTGEKPFAAIRSQCPSLAVIPTITEAVVERNERPTKPESSGDAFARNGLTDEIWGMVERCLDADPDRRPSARNITEYEFMM